MISQASSEKQTRATPFLKVSVDFPGIHLLQGNILEKLSKRISLVLHLFSWTFYHGANLPCPLSFRNNVAFHKQGITNNTNKKTHLRNNIAKARAWPINFTKIWQSKRASQTSCLKIILLPSISENIPTCFWEARREVLDIPEPISKFIC